MCHQTETSVSAGAGEVANVKYRTLDKKFRQVKGADKILYGLDDAIGQDTIIIVEGAIILFDASTKLHCCVALLC